MHNNIYQFDISGSTTKREWAVYIIVAKHTSSAKRYLYVGKVGDNRDGCNPIISRIGNHLSYNKVHSQLRNKLEKKGYTTSDYSYAVYFATFGDYEQDNHIADRDRINEMERRLNLTLQKEINAKQADYELLNPLSGKYLPNKAERKRRSNLLKDDELNILKVLASQSLDLG